MSLPFRASVLALLVLAGCDGSGPEAPSGSPVGSWASEATTQRTLATSNQRQDIVDSGRPAGARLALTGAESGTFLYVSTGFTYEGRRAFTVFSVDSRRQPFPATYAFLSLDPFGTTVTFWRGGAYRQFYQAHTEPPYTFEGGRLTVRPLTLVAPDGDTVLVSGTLEVPTFTLEPGVEAEIDRRFQTEEPADVRRRTLGWDGTYREEWTGPQSPTARTGTWEDLGGGRLRITPAYGGASQAVEFSYSIDDGILSLGTVQDSCAPGPCQGYLRGLENRYGLASGSLTRVREERAEILASVSP